MRRQRSMFALVLVHRTRALNTASDTVAQRYEPHRRHRALFEPAKITRWLHPEFRQLLDDAGVAEAADKPARYGVTEEAAGVFSFPLLTDDACEMLIEEVEHFQETGLPARRPNSMNNYGLVLNEIGLRPTLSALQTTIHPLALAVFPREAATFDGHHSFVVSYRPDEDRGLDMHVDDSDVTLNVCLGREFEASGLTFCGSLGAADHRLVSHKYKHQRGRALLHLGRRRHGADDIASGHRVNLIMWNWNSAYRQTAAYRSPTYAAEEREPDALCVSFTHDRDYEAVTGEERPPAGVGASGRPIDFGEAAWCPPPHAEYDGFQGRGGRYRDRMA